MRATSTLSPNRKLGVLIPKGPKKTTARDGELACMEVLIRLLTWCANKWYCCVRPMGMTQEQNSFGKFQPTAESSMNLSNSVPENS